MAKRKRDIQAAGLAVLNRVAGSKTLDALHLKKPAERALYQASKTGFRVADLAGRPLQTVKDLLSPARRETRPELFDLSPSEEQQQLVDSVQRFARDVLRPACEDAETHQEVSENTWRRAFELGLGQLAVPEVLGGESTGPSPLTSILLSEALAWGDMGQTVALLSPVGVANALARWGNSDQQIRYLAAFAHEDPPDAALALTEAGPLADPAAPSCRGEQQGDGWRLNGSKALVPLGEYAELLIISADLQGLGPRLVLLDGQHEGIRCRPEPAMGLRAASLARIELKDIEITASDLLGDTQSLQTALDLSRLSWCALALGTAQAVLDYVIPYVNQRQAFGEPLSQRQAVAFKVAQMSIDIDAMRLMLWRAAARAEHGMNFSRETALALRYCTDKAVRIGSDGVQLLGGHGFVKQHPVERWYRDLRAVGMCSGGPLA